MHDGYRIAESLWLAGHAGTTREVLDLDTGARQPVAERVEALLQTLAPTAQELGTARELARLRILATANGADRQRQVVRTYGLERLVDWVADETIASAARYRGRVDTGAKTPAIDRDPQARALATST